MANTVIQLKFSTVTATPPSLNVAEPAYSYTSNTLFIGSPAGTGAIAIGGKFYLDQQADIYNLVNSAFSAANSAGSSQFVVYAANHANAAYNQANTNAGDITVIQGVNLTQNTNITNAQNTADAAFIRANNSLNANTGGVITGPVTVASNLTITGNLTIIGNTVTTDIQTLNISDPLIYLAANNYSGDAVEIGFVANYFDGSTQRHTGFFREASNKEYYVFDNYTLEPDANLIDINDASFRVATLHANLKTQLITLNGQDLQTYVNNAFNKSNAAYDQANTNAGDIASIQDVNLTQNTNITNAQNSANAAFIHANAAFNQANTDVTNVNITSADYGSASAVASFQVAANGRIVSANSTAISLSASAITSGTLSVERGGTGAGTFTTNGVLLGQGTSALTTASSSTEGHVLTINNAGVPTFAHLSGGTF